MEDQLHTDTGTALASGDPRLDRLGALGGIGFTVLALASALVVPAAPAVDEPAGEIRDYVVDHQTGLGISTVLYAAGMLAFIAFVAMVHRRVSATARSPVAAGTFLVAGTAGVTLGLLAVLVEAALVQRIALVADQATIVAWYGLWDIVAFTGPPLAVNLAMGVAAFVLYRDRTIPRWLAAVAAASIVLGTIAVVADLVTDSTVPVAVDLGGFLLANVWIVGVSVAVLLRSRSGAEVPSPLDAGAPARPAAI
jgi:hypothetical protein